MADDGRRAEIEVLLERAAEQGWTVGATAAAILDLVRDARGDDEDDLRQWLLRVVGSASSVHSAKSVVERLVADALARPPQGEDEATVEAPVRVRVVGSMHDWLAEHFPEAVEPFKAWAIGVRNAPGGDEDRPPQTEAPMQSDDQIAEPMDYSPIWSPQSEDHEAGIEAASDALLRMFGDEEVRASNVMSITMGVIEAYLSRVPPSRDGTGVSRAQR